MMVNVYKGCRFVFFGFLLIEEVEKWFWVIFREEKVSVFIFFLCFINDIFFIIIFCN